MANKGDRYKVTNIHSSNQLSEQMKASTMLAACFTG